MKFLKKCYQFNFGVFTLTILFIFVFTFAGCVDTTNENRTTDTYNETVDNIFWEVTYDTETREVVSIRTPYLLANADTVSPFYRFMVTYQGEGALVVQAVKLTGIALGSDNFKIEQTTMYVTSGSRADWEIIKGTFPDCTYTESSYDVTDEETGEVYTVTDEAIIFAETVTSYVQKILFTVPEA